MRNNGILNAEDSENYTETTDKNDLESYYSDVDNPHHVPKDDQVRPNKAPVESADNAEPVDNNGRASVLFRFTFISAVCVF